MNTKKTFTSSYLQNLTLSIFFSIIAGIIAGTFFPYQLKGLTSIIDAFFKLLEVLILPVIFFAIIYGICCLSEVPNANRLIWQTLLYFFLLTSISILLGFTFAFLIEPGKNTEIELPDSKLAFSTIYKENDDGSLLSIIYLNRHTLFLLTAIGFGAAIYCSEMKTVISNKLNKLLDFFNSMIKYVYLLLPIIIFCNIAHSISIYGIAALLPLSKVLATVYISCIVFVFGLLGLVTRLFGISIWSFLVFIREEILLVMATSSSKTAFPMIFEKLNTQGYNLNILRFVIPLSYCFNLAGACIYLSVSCVFFIQFYNISLSTADYIWLFIVISLSSKMASGIPGSGFLVLIFTLSRFGKIPITDIGLLYGIDRFMNEARSVTNFIGIAVCAAIMSKINQKDSLLEANGILNNLQEEN